MVKEDYDFDCDAIYINEDTQTKKHIDSSNVGTSLFFWIGDCSGGQTIIYDKEDTDKVVRTIEKNEIVKFNGGEQYHETLPFEGKRYSFVFYKTRYYHFVKRCLNNGMEFILSNDNNYINRTLETIDRNKGVMLLTRQKAKLEKELNRNVDFIINCSTKWYPKLIDCYNKKFKMIGDCNIYEDMKDYIIAIPSHKRADILKSKTLNMLKNNDISKDNIYVFVAEDEIKDYEDIDCHLVVGRKGICNQRKYIREYFNEGCFIVSMDDDIESIDFSLSVHNDLDTFIRYAFNYIKKEKANIFGIYPVYNPFFREQRKEVTSCLSFIIGAFYGFINQKNNNNLDYEISVKYNGNKEDVEQSIKYFIQDGKTIRFNRIGYKSKIYNKSGGLGTMKERLEDMKKSALELKEIYPNYGNIKVRKNGLYEFVLNRFAKN